MMTASVLAKLILLAPGTMAAGASGMAEAAEEADTEGKTGYAPVNGLRICYEIHGTAPGGCPPLGFTDEREELRVERLGQSVA
ncbi:MAG: hypothetical protein J0H49_33505 [Acidobacteria bacterium]|nr:hypothetical protein [Acidobacteriota bacterium]